jgi:heterodisulfide reductase subunit B
MTERDRKRDLIAAERARGCLCCGLDDPQIMEIHHVERAEKTFSVATMKYKVSLEELVAELSKCVTLCPNCHAYADRGIYEIEQGDPDHEHETYVCRRPGWGVCGYHDADE